MGCKLCAEVQQKQPEKMAGLMVHRHVFARFEAQHDLRAERFEKHQHSPAHAVAVRAFASSAGEEPVDDNSAPSFEDWQTLLEHKGSGAIPGVGQAAKRRVMRWCIAAARRMNLKEKVKDSFCVSIQQDTRGNRFLLRFRCCGADLSVSKGTMSVMKHVGTVQAPGADGIRQATMSAIQKFCADEAPPHYGGARSSRTDPILDKDFLVSLCQKMECFAGVGGLRMKRWLGMSCREVLSLAPVFQGSRIRCVSFCPR